MRAGFALPRLVALGAIIVLAGATAISQPMSSVAAVPGGFVAQQSDPQAVSLLQRAYHAQTAVFYEGHAVMGVDGDTDRGHIVHIPGHGTTVTSSGGHTGSFEADNDERGQALQLLLDHYIVQLAGTTTRAGRPTQVVAALRPDGSVAARLWVDQASAVVLARQAYDASGRVYEDMHFTDVVVGDDSGGKIQAQSMTASAAPDHTDPANLVDAARTLRSQGWHVAVDLPGGFELYDARVAGSGAGAVLHLSYTDGLCSLSLFQQRGRLASAALRGWHTGRIGHRTVYVDDAGAQRLAWQGGSTVYALIADATPPKVAAVVRALPSGHADSGVVARMERGFTRLGEWFDPFH